jgi:hypothetical protein
MNTDLYKPRRLKILDPGLSDYTGSFGSVEFVHGTSVGEVSWREGVALGSITQIVDADDLTYQINPAADHDRMRETTSDDPVVQAFGKTVVNPEGELKSAAMQKFTREELEKIADEKGLAGVRNIANAVGRTGRSIVQCIDNILDEQGNDPGKRRGTWLEDGAGNVADEKVT